MAVMITRYNVQQAQIITADEIIVPPLGLCGLVRLLLGGMLCRCQVSALITEQCCTWGLTLALSCLPMSLAPSH